MISRRTMLSGLAGPALVPASPRALADTYPTRPVTLIVPFAPGGSTSVMARIIAERMGELLGQQMIVDNRPGAGGSLAARSFVRAEPDGYTLMLGSTSTLATGPNLSANPGFDARRDFAPVGLIGWAPTLLVASPQSGLRSLPELIARAKAAPGGVSYGSSGVGSLTHMAGELFGRMAGVKLMHVPYKGSTPVLTDLMGGHIQVGVVPIPAVHGQIEGGALPALAVTSAMRSVLLPDVPTVAESGLPGYEAVLRYGLLARAGTPRPVIARLNAVLREALGSQAVLKRIAFEGAEPLPSSPEDYAADIDRDEAKWSSVLREAGLRASE